MTDPAPRAEGEPPAPSPKKKPWVRLVVLVVVLVALYAVGRATGLTEHLSRAEIRALMERLGVLGFFVFLALFSLGELVHVPGIVFVLAALLAYGRLWGGLAAYAGALVSVSFAFALVRRVGGQALGSVTHPRITKVLARLDRAPIATIALLRLVLFLTPALNYVLAMTNVKYRHYIAGSALGLALPIAVVAVAFEWVLAHVG